jgi:hypothetical protein
MEGTERELLFPHIFLRRAHLYLFCGRRARRLGLQRLCKEARREAL